jgi:adenylate cyclase
VSEIRKIAAILVADVVGFSRLASADEDRTLSRLRALRGDLIDPAVAAHHGRMVKRTGDGLIAEFRSMVDAVRCAIEMQKGFIERNEGVQADRRIDFRIGIHLGDVVEESDGDLMGDGVNVAARLEGICEPGGICLSEDAYRQVKSRLEVQVADLGPQNLKNIAEPVRAYLLRQAAARKTSATGKNSARRISVLAVGLAVALVTAGTYAWREGLVSRLVGSSVAEDMLKAAPRVSIVVLPFENLSGDKGQDYWADGITDDLTTDLSHLPDSFVIAHNTALTYKGKPVDAKQIGRELGVRYALEGSVRREGDAVEVNAQLVSTETGAHVWADRFEAEVGRLGKLQFEVVARLAHSLDVELVRAENLRAMRERPNNPDARDLVFRAAAILLSNNINRSDCNDAIRMAERALDFDRQNVFAMIDLATALTVRVYRNWSQNESADLARADKLIDAALALQPDYTWAHFAKGWIFSLNQQWAQALTETEIAIEDDRSNAKAYASAGLYKIHLGRSAESVADLETALRLSPHDNDARGWQAYLCYGLTNSAQWEKGIEQCEKAVAAIPEDWIDHKYVLGNLTAAYSWAGHDTDAKNTLARLSKFDVNYMGAYQSTWDANDNPKFRAELGRVMEGLRRAAAPEVRRSRVEPAR